MLLKLIVCTSTQQNSPVGKLGNKHHSVTFIILKAALLIYSIYIYSPKVHHIVVKQYE